MKYEKVELSDEQRKFLTDFISKGHRKARAIRRAQILLLLDEGLLGKGHIATQLRCDPDTVTLVLKRFHNSQGNLEEVLTEWRERSNRPPPAGPN